MLLLRDVQNKIFTDFTVNRCKIVDVDGKTRTIGFKVYRNDYDKIVFEIEQKYEKYCVI